MSKLVIAIRNGQVVRATLCRTEAGAKRVANSWNEYARLWNRRFGYDKNRVAIITEPDLLRAARLHEGIPKHAPREKLDRARSRRNLRNMPVRGRVQ